MYDTSIIIILLCIRTLYGVHMIPMAFISCVMLQPMVPLVNLRKVAVGRSIVRGQI